MFPPGAYEITTEATGFRRLEGTASVLAGTTTTVNLTLQLGEVSQTVTGDEASPQIRFDSHSVGGFITRAQLQDLPWKGRSFLDLAKLEPGTQPITRERSSRCSGNRSVTMAVEQGSPWTAAAASP